MVADASKGGAGPRNLITDVPGLRVGNAQDQTLKSGVTVLTADAPFTASHHTMGGAPGSRETELLAPDKSVAQVDALVLSGGSAFGLDSCSGVMDGLHAMGRGFAVGDVRVPIVPGAILFDLLNGGEKDWVRNPYRSLGRAALEGAGETFEIGSYGAGTGALTGSHKGGLGSASFIMPDGTVVGALVAANPVGNVVSPDGHLWAAPYLLAEDGPALAPCPSTGHGGPFFSAKMGGAGANTTIGIVATNAPLTKAQCQRLAIAAHDGLARAIVPAHTPLDGDLIFALSTGPQTPQTETNLAQLGHIAAMCMSRAIVRAVLKARPAETDTLPCMT